GMQTSEIKMLTSVSEYLGLAMTLIIAFGICFQLPVVLTLLARIELVNVEMLQKGRRYAIVGILIVAALITPPDPISQIGLATPLYLLYELSILAVRWMKRSQAQKLTTEATEQTHKAEATTPSRPQHERTVRNDLTTHMFDIKFTRANA